jgi:hypothetical protein
MKTKTLHLTTGTLLFFAVSLMAANEGGGSIVLKIRHNGKAKSPPTQVIVEFDGRSAQLPLRNDGFEVAPEVRTAKKVTISFSLKKEQIRIPDINGSKFNATHWTVLLEDKTFGPDYAWAAPKGARVASSCVLVFELTDSDGTAAFIPDCRTKTGGARVAHP